MRIETSERGNVNFPTLEEALKIVGEKPDESNSLRQKMAVVRVQQFLDDLYYYED
jgi:hypothetical protein